MRATIKNYIEAAKRRREEEGDESGFSLIELIIVVVILGILIAIAIPIFGSIQTTARHNALEAAAANGATAVAAAIANGDDVDVAADSAGSGSGANAIDVTISTDTGKVGSEDDATAICVVAENDEGEKAWAGTLAGCNSHSWTP